MMNQLRSPSLMILWLNGPELARLPFPFPFQEDSGSVCLCSSEHYDIAELPVQTVEDAQQAPISHDNYYLNGRGAARRRLFVGIDQGTDHVGNLAPFGMRNGFDVRHGRLADGAGADVVSTYLAQGTVQDGLIRRHATRPVLRFHENTSTEDLNRLVRAVQMVNMALPLEWRIEMAADSVDESIFVEFVPFLPSNAGTTDYDLRPDPTRLEHATIRIDRNNYIVRNERLAG